MFGRQAPPLPHQETARLHLLKTDLVITAPSGTGKTARPAAKIIFQTKGGLLKLLAFLNVIRK